MVTGKNNDKSGQGDNKKPPRFRRRRRRGHQPRVERLLNAVREHDIQAVVTDLDGTTYGFWHYFVPAMRVAIPHIADVLGLGKNDYDRISQDCGRVMAKYGTHEHPWSLEETWMRREWKGSPVEFRDQIVRPFWSELDHYRQKYLRLYDFVWETSECLRDAGIPHVGLSDAPAHMAVVRVTQTRLDQLLYGVYALETVEPSLDAGLSDEDLEFGRERVRRFAHTQHNMRVMRTMPKDHEKPSPRGIKLIMEQLGITDPKKILMVGDSLTKDGGVAQAIGCPYVWAWYGVNLPPDYLEMIDWKFNPHAGSQQIVTGHGVSHRPKVYPPMVGQGATYAAVLDHLKLNRTGSGGTILPPSVRPTATNAAGH